MKLYVANILLLNLGNIALRESPKSFKQKIDETLTGQTSKRSLGVLTSLSSKTWVWCS